MCSPAAGTAGAAIDLSEERAKLQHVRARQARCRQASCSYVFGVERAAVFGDSKKTGLGLAMTYATKSALRSSLQHLSSLH